MRQAIAGAGGDIERTGLIDWDLDELPRLVEREVAGQRIKGYPALVDDGDTVSVQVLDTPEAQHEAMWSGTRRLLERGVARAGQVNLRAWATTTAWSSAPALTRAWPTWWTTAWWPRWTTPWLGPGRRCGPAPTSPTCGVG